jgi:N-carbamoylputrescine amidase
MVFLFIMSKLKLAWIQGKSQGNLEANIPYYVERIKKLAQNKPDIILLPELFLSDYFAIEEEASSLDFAISLDSEVITLFKNLCKELGVNLSFPFYEKVSSAIRFNSMIIIDKNGELISHYRKMHIPDDPGFYEKYYFRPGDKGFQVASLDKAKLGLLICWDQWFPEAARLTAMQGAEVIFYPTAIAWDDNEDQSVYQEQLAAWKTSMKAHAIANNVFVIAVNRVGREGHLQFWGNSFCVDPFGKEIYSDATDEALTELEIDLTQIEEARKIWPFFRDRRTDAYSGIEKSWL